MVHTASKCVQYRTGLSSVDAANYYVDTQIDPQVPARTVVWYAEHKPVTGNKTSGSRPLASASFMASSTAWNPRYIIRLLQSFVVAPEPRGPVCTMLEAEVANQARQRSRSSASPRTPACYAWIDQ